MVNEKMYTAALKSLWTGKCTITINNTNTVDKNTGRTVLSKTDIYMDEPCRISFDTVNVPEQIASASKAVQSITLFISNKINIPPGSKITVTQNGVTAEYVKSGKPAVYTAHQEIPLELKKEWI